MGYSFTYMCAYDKFMWFRKSIKSFIGVFGNMRYYAPPVVYYAYFAIFIGGTIAYLINAVRTRAEKDRWPLLLLLFASSASCIAVSLLQSYFRAGFSRSIRLQPSGFFCAPAWPPTRWRESCSGGAPVPFHISLEPFRACCRMHSSDRL